LLLTRGSGGWSKVAKSDKATVQLYDMQADPGEQTNVYTSYPEVAKTLIEQLRSDVDRGRSTDGPDLANDVPVNIKASQKK